MSTRAIYTFEGFDEAYHVFKHHDGYPTGAADALRDTLAFAWELPRYEPDEFAAAFVTANKVQAGCVRIASDRYHASDVAFGYTIRPNKEIPTLLEIVVAETNYVRDEPEEKHIWTGPLVLFLRHAERIENDYYGEETTNA